MMTDDNTANVKRGRRSMLMLALFFIAPILIAWVILANYGQLGTEKTKNYGELISPARPLLAFSLQTLDGNPFTLDELRGKWSMVYFDDGHCQGACEQDLFMARQSRLSQNEEVRRVARLLVLSAAPSGHLKKILAQHPDLTVVVGTAGAINQFQQQFEIGGTVPVARAQHMYLVDPLGNLMMFYTSGFNARGVIRDLQHLLKWSQIG